MGLCKFIGRIPLVIMAGAVAKSDTGCTVAPLRWLVAPCALALLATASVVSAQSQWAPTSAQVTRAIDGEVIEVKIGDRVETVRYIGISTPEVQHPTRERYSQAAKAANARLASGKNVQLVFDVQRRDRYGRLLAYVYADDSFLNAELVAAGYAEVATYPPNVRQREIFMRRQREARQARRGLWADPDAAQYHRPRLAGVFGDTRLQIYFHPDVSARHLLLADPFVYFESPQHAAAAGYRPSMDYASVARREQQILSGEALPPRDTIIFHPSPNVVPRDSSGNVSTRDGTSYSPYGSPPQR
jgi:micrococcal nuclease